MLDLFPGIIASPVQAASMYRICVLLTARRRENKNALSLKKNVFVMNCIIKRIMYLQISMRKTENLHTVFLTLFRSYGYTTMKLRALVCLYHTESTVKRFPSRVL